MHTHHPARTPAIVHAYSCVRQLRRAITSAPPPSECECDLRSADNRGFKATKILPLIRGRRYNIMAAICCDGLCAVEVYDSSNSLDTVMHFMLNHLLANCGEGGPMNAFPGLCSVLVLDNASIHHAENELLRRLCETRGVRVEFLPAYSPDLNPIEEFFSGCKSRIRRDYHQLSVSDTPVDDLKYVFSLEGSASNAQGWIRHAGYYDM